jgi:hypothetical protein
MLLTLYITLICINQTVSVCHWEKFYVLNKVFIQLWVTLGPL